ncbi:MAG: GntR family transcriptional regulator [Pseudomonadota bacterium]|nr:GntR family transcriptional regulator [Pseudomonadota bacterium]
MRAVLGIRELIHAGAVAPGERLSELDMAERLGLSRTPVRAALARLEQEGLLVPLANGGYAAREFSESDVRDAIELRGVLEGTAARRAAERGAPAAGLAAAREALARIDAILAPGPAALDFPAYMEANEAFHAILSGLAGSALVARQIAQVTRLPFAGPSAFIDAQSRMPEVRESLILAQAQHRGLVEAVAAREGARAEALGREHARLALRNLDAAMRDRALAARVPGLGLVTR